MQHFKVNPPALKIDENLYYQVESIGPLRFMNSLIVVHSAVYKILYFPSFCSKTKLCFKQWFLR